MTDSGKILRRCLERINKYRKTCISCVNKRGRLLGEIAKLELCLVSLEYASIVEGGPAVSVEGYSKKDAQKMIDGLRRDFNAEENHLNMVYTELEKQWALLREINLNILEEK